MTIKTSSSNETFTFVGDFNCSDYLVTGHRIVHFNLQSCSDSRFAAVRFQVADHSCDYRPNELFASNRISMLCAKNSGIVKGQILLVAGRKCLAKSCFHVQRKDFGEKPTHFRRSFIANGLGEC